MKILAIETSGTIASVALIEGDVYAGKVVIEYTVNNSKNHSVSLMPMIQTIFEQSGVETTTLDYIAVASGPGSFTGLRIGSATAKGLAHGLNLPIIEVPTLLAMAYNLQGYDGYVIPMMDARRNQVYTGVFECSDGRMNPLIEDQAISIEGLADLLKLLLKKPMMLLGDGIQANESLIREYFSQLDYQIAPVQLINQKASSVGVVALMKALRGEVVSYQAHAPNYIRLCQAERELKERISGSLS